MDDRIGGVVRRMHYSPSHSGGATTKAQMGLVLKARERQTHAKFSSKLVLRSECGVGHLGAMAVELE